MKQFVIRGDRGKYWSNEEGWVDHIDMADVFSEDERHGPVFLPLGGLWEEVVGSEA